MKMKIIKAGLSLALAALLITSCAPSQPSTGGHSSSPTVYVTRKSLEPDKLASIWLIQRFVQTNAQFVFVEDQAPLANGIPFDVPEAEFRRYATRSCFESILHKHSVTHPPLLRLGEIIHDIEINYWGEKKYPESTPLRRELQMLIDQNSADPRQCLPQAFQIFDHLLAELPNPAK